MSDLTTPLKICQSTNGTVHVPNSSDNIAVLQSALADSIEIEWEVNSNYTAQLTAYDDGSEAFNLLEVQNFVEIAGQWFVIKQIQPDYSGGITTVAVTLSHIYNEVSRMRHYGADAPIDWGNGGNGSSSLEVPSGDSSGDSSQTQQVLPQDILKAMFDGNNWGVTYQVIGSFDAVNVDSPYASGSGKDFLDRIIGAWPDCVIYPDNLNIRVYSHDEFYKNYGHRLDYLHDTNEVSLTYDTTSMQNSARLVGATYSQNSTSDTGLPSGTAGKGAAAVQRDAKKYLGVPYVWGGAGGSRGGNPYSGMDCSSFVSQVYQDFGISIPAYTVSMESYGHEISRDQVQTGDLGFYGTKGASYHICMALDNNTIIYEPQPGEVCKMEPISYYPPTWWERNDDMAKVVGGGDSGDGSDATTTDSKKMYYFAPFWYRNQESYNRWGSFAGGDITSDTIQNKDDMMRYADTQFKLNPDLEIDITLDGNIKPIAGEVIRVEVKPKRFVTTVPMVGYNWHPYSKGTATTEIFNSNGKNILDFDNSQTRTVNDIRQQVKTYITNSTTTPSGQETWTESEAEQYANSERN